MLGFKENFDENNYKYLSEIIESAEKGDYIVSDCDNSAVMYDTEENLFFYQVLTLSFKMDAKEFREVIFKDLPDDPRIKNEAIYAANLAVKFYEILIDDKNFDENPCYTDFVAVMNYLYLEVARFAKAPTGWFRMLYLFKNFTEDELRKMVREMYKYTRELNFQVIDLHYSGEFELNSKIEVGVDKFKEIESLFRNIREKGANVHICTASARIVVEEFLNCAMKGAFTDVVGLEIKKSSGVFLAEVDTDRILTMLEGKREYIEILKEKYNRAPLLFIGDSDGDYFAFTDPGLKYGLIIDRKTSGKIESLKEMARNKSFEDTVYLLQKRDEELGCFRR